MILTDEEIRKILGVNAMFCPQMEYAREIESAVLEKLNPRIAKLEAVLRECLESLDAVTKWNAPPDFNGRKIDRIVEKAIAKIDWVLK